MLLTTESPRLESLIRALDRLLPPRYAAYRPLVARGFVAFLEGLPAARREEIERSQTELDADAPAELRLLALLRSSPVLHKLGQTLARDRRLDPALRRALQLLETLPPRLTMAEIVPLLGEAARVATPGAPLAEGSVAAVVSCRGLTADGAAADGVLKVLKPGIEERLAEDLAVWPELGRYLEVEGEALGLVRVAWSDTLDQVRDLLLAEIDLVQEQRHLEAAVDFYRGDRNVEVPRLLQGSGPRVTAMTRIHGVQATSLQDGQERRRVARAVLDALIARPLFTGGGEALFHGDPHAGNLLWTPEGRLGILDWALASTVDQRSLGLVVSLVVAASRLDRRAMAHAVRALAGGDVDAAALDRVVGESLRSLLRGSLPGLAWLLRLLDRAALEAGARFGSNLLLFRKSLLTLDGVIRDLAPDYPITLDLAVNGLARLIEEWPRRLLVSPSSRGFATHLSNWDLVSLLWLGPARTRNFLREGWRAGLSAGAGS